MDDAMSGFQQMAAQLAGMSKLQARLRSVGDVTTEVGHVRKHLIDGPKTTEELQALTGLNAKQIWGRLKWDMQQGRIERVDDKFQLAEDGQESIDAAIKLLRRNGYAVTRMKRRACG